MSWISKKLLNCQDPYVYGKALEGDSKEKWRYRLGVYRMISHIEDKKIIILNVEAALIDEQHLKT